MYILLLCSQSAETAPYSLRGAEAVKKKLGDENDWWGRSLIPHIYTWYCEFSGISSCLFMLSKTHFTCALKTAEPFSNSSFFLLSKFLFIYSLLLFTWVYNNSWEIIVIYKKSLGSCKKWEQNCISLNNIDLE